MHIYANVALLLLHRTREREREEKRLYFSHAPLWENWGGSFLNYSPVCLRQRGRRRRLKIAPRKMSKKAEVLGDTVEKQVWRNLKTYSIFKTNHL